MRGACVTPRVWVLSTCSVTVPCVVIDGAVESVPDAIVDQLAHGGRLVTGLVDRGVTRLALGRRTDGGFGLVDFADLDCVVLPGFAKPKTFQFAR